MSQSFEPPPDHDATVDPTDGSVRHLLVLGAIVHRAAFLETAMTGLARILVRDKPRELAQVKRGIPFHQLIQRVTDWSSRLGPAYRAKVAETEARARILMKRRNLVVHRPLLLNHDSTFAVFDLRGLETATMSFSELEQLASDLGEVQETIEGLFHEAKMEAWFLDSL